MKLRSHNLMGLLYTVLLALPFCAILSRVIYVQSNKNAYQSYSGSINQQEVINNLPSNEINNTNDFILNNYYEIYFNTQIISEGEVNYTILDDTGVNNFKIITYYTEADDFKSEYKFNEIDYLTINTETASNGYIINSDNNDDDECLVITNINSLTSFNTYILIQVIDLTNISSVLNLNYFRQPTYFQNYTVNNIQSTTLDNVFEYSVNKFIDDNNFGRINFFQWTTDLFFDDKQVNNMYVHFVNWYLNYTLLISATYILFLGLMWFVNYARRLLERGMNYDW